MTAHPDAYDAALRRADAHARAWLASLRDRPVPASAKIDELADALGGPLPEAPTDPAEVIDLLAVGAEPGLVAMPSGRFFGFVLGGTHPAALAADWLGGARGQKNGPRPVTPAPPPGDQT